MIDDIKDLQTTAITQTTAATNLNKLAISKSLKLRPKLIGPKPSGSMLENARGLSVKSARLVAAAAAAAASTISASAPLTRASSASSKKLLNPSNIMKIAHIKSKDKLPFREKTKRLKVEPAPIDGILVQQQEQTECKLAENGQTSPAVASSTLLPSSHHHHQQQRQSNQVMIPRANSRGMMITNNSQDSVASCSGVSFRPTTNLSSMNSTNSNDNRVARTNPLNWSAQDVCRYLVENKFDAHLVYLIEEHVSKTILKIIRLNKDENKSIIN